MHTCISCGSLYKKSINAQKYCGSITKKIGCSWKNHLIQKKGTLLQRRKWRESNRKNRKKYKYLKKYKPREKTEKEKLASKLYRIKTRITLDYYKNLIVKQNNLCAICGLAESKKALAIDHCHKTGKVRGLLCQKCNRALGGFKDNPTLLRKAYQYLTFIWPEQG